MLTLSTMNAARSWLYLLRPCTALRHPQEEASEGDLSQESSEELGPTTWAQGSSVMGAGSSVSDVPPAASRVLQRVWILQVKILPGCRCGLSGCGATDGCSVLWSKKRHICPAVGDMCLQEYCNRGTHYDAVHRCL